MYRLAFDIGGTFTDFVLHDTRDDSLRLWKIPTSSDAPAEAVATALRDLFASGTVSADDISGVLHATTVATNAILERRGARVALITTRGFRDVALIGRQKRPDTNDFNLGKQKPVVARRDIFEITERVEADGSVHTPLDATSVESTVAAVQAAGYDAVAIMFLHAYANPTHERTVAEALRARCPGLDVSLSSDVSPKYREYERVTTTTVNAYVQPIVHRYLDRIEQAMTGEKVRADLQIMQSNGGLVSPRLARSFPVRIVESGPAAGVLMCARLGQEEGFDHLLTFDMGGTTAKLGAIDHGEPTVVPIFEVDAIRHRKGSGLPLNITAIELLEIGAGGGSLAEAAMGLIRVGPQSAGAVPGPICYARGGTRPTITDANLVLGYLDPAYFNGGAMTLDFDAARRGIAEHVGAPLGLDADAAAWGIHSVANSTMERAMRVVSVERGRDPRTHVMIAFGGAGPLHAARLARALGIPKVMVPYGAGVGSALGLLVADQKLDNSLTRVLPVAEGMEAAIAEVYAELETRLRGELANMPGGDGAVELRRAASMRYRGQGYELRVEVPAGDFDAGFAQRLRAAFEASYAANYGYVDDNAQPEAIDWHLMAVIPQTARVSLGSGAAEGSADAPPRSRRSAWFPETGGFTDTLVVSRYALAPGERIAGPALIEERESTTVVLPGDSAHVTRRGHLMVEIGTEDCP